MTTKEKGDWFDDAGGDDEPVGSPEADAPADPALDAEEQRLIDEALLFAEADAAGLDPDNLFAGVGATELTGDAAQVAIERDEYREALMRVKADFENYKKRIAKDHAATVERAAEKLVTELLPVLDACEAALDHGSTDVEPIYKSLLDTLEKAGLVRVSPEGHPFDPNLHEAVMHEPGDGDEIVVSESLRTGYVWNGRVVRPAMVKVKG